MSSCLPFVQCYRFKFKANILSLGWSEAVYHLYVLHLVIKREIKRGGGEEEGEVVTLFVF